MAEMTELKKPTAEYLDKAGLDHYNQKIKKYIPFYPDDEAIGTGKSQKIDTTNGRARADKSNKVYMDSSLALGKNNTIGIESEAAEKTKYGAFVNGDNCSATDTGAIANGTLSIASGKYSLASGTSNISSGENSVSLGSGNKSIGTSTVTLGENNIASFDGDISIGQWNYYGSNTRPSDSADCAGNVSIGVKNVLDEAKYSELTNANHDFKRNVIIGNSNTLQQSGLNNMILGNSNNIIQGNSNYIIGADNKVLSQLDNEDIAESNILIGQNLIAGYDSGGYNRQCNSIIIGRNNMYDPNFMDSAIIIGNGSTTTKHNALIINQRQTILDNEKIKLNTKTCTIGESLNGQDYCITLGKYNAIANVLSNAIFMVGSGEEGAPQNSIEVSNTNTKIYGSDQLLLEASNAGTVNIKGFDINIAPENFLSIGKSNQYISLDENGINIGCNNNVSVISNGTVDISGSKVNLNSQNSLIIKAIDDIKFEANNVDIKANIISKGKTVYNIGNFTSTHPTPATVVYTLSHNLKLNTLYAINLAGKMHNINTNISSSYLTIYSNTFYTDSNINTQLLFEDGWSNIDSSSILEIELLYNTFLKTMQLIVTANQNALIRIDNLDLCIGELLSIS